MNIFFIPAPGPKPWQGDTLGIEPLGGSESAVIYMARALQKLGHSVVVVTNGRPGIYSGVNYFRYEAISEHIQDLDVLISSRAPAYLKIKELQGAKLKVLWLHDFPQVAGKDLNNVCDILFAISPFHAQCFTGSNTVVTQDGVDASLFNALDFDEAPKRNPNRMIWTSNPNRGLYVAYELFKEIRKQIPKMEFHIFGRSGNYGWGEGSPLHERWYLPPETETNNVFLHEGLNKVELAKELMESTYWFYPSHWPETFCMAALEAQCAGCICVAPPEAALVTTIGDRGLLTYKFVDEVVELHKNKDRPKKLSEEARKWAREQTWDAIAKSWAKLFEDVIEEMKELEEEIPFAWT